MERVAMVCPHCGAEEHHDRRHGGEMKRVHMCRDCGEWYTIFE